MKQALEIQMNQKSNYRNNCVPILKEVMEKYGFAFEELASSPYYANDILFRRNEDYVIFSVFDDYRDPSNDIRIKLGVGDLDDREIGSFSSVPYTVYINELDWYKPIDREDWKAQTVIVLNEFEDKAKLFLKGDNNKVVELSKTVERNF